LGVHDTVLTEAVAAIQQKREGVLQKWKDFRDSAGSRRQTLENARGLQEFLRNADEIEQWIEDKMKTATDESYRDPSNMQVRLPCSGAHQSHFHSISMNFRSKDLRFRRRDHASYVTGKD
jgi:hypothetical protein